MEDFQTIFVVTVDTEADNAWDDQININLKNLAAVQRFQELCESYGIFPTYLLTYECATRDEAISILKPISDASQCEIGHHLHCWTTPPFQKEEPSGVDSAWINAYQFELPDSLFEEKAEHLRSEIEMNYRVSPTSHRAGRWGIDQRTVNWLVRKQFIAESSVVPLVDYSMNFGRKTGGPSFRGESRLPFLWHGAMADDSERACLVEIPVTVDVSGGFISRTCAEYLKRELVGCSVVDRIFKKFGGVRMLRPDPKYANGMGQLIIDHALQERALVVNMMLHSSELALHCSPFTKTQDDLTRIWEMLEETFRYVAKIGMRPVSLSKAAELLKPHLIHRHVKWD